MTDAGSSTAEPSLTRSMTRRPGFRQGPADVDGDVGPEAETGADADGDADVEPDSLACTPDTYDCDSTTVSAHCNTAGTGPDGSWNCEVIYGTNCNSRTGRCVGA